MIERYIATEEGKGKGYENDFVLLEFTGENSSLEEIFPYLYHVCITNYVIKWSEGYKEIESIIGYIPVTGDKGSYSKEIIINKGDICVFFDKRRPWWATFVKDSPELIKFLSNFKKVNDKIIPS